MKEVAIIYTRVSSERQVENMSLPEQRKTCVAFCKRKEWKVQKIFVEEGESAKTADRTQLNELLEYCRLNRDTIGHLVVYKIDRFARSMEDHIALRTLLKKMGILLWSATEPVNDSNTGKLLENVLASFAQFDNEQRADRCRRGMVARAMEGCWVSHAPIGFKNYKLPDKRPTLILADDDTVKKVRRFFNEYLSGKYTQSDAGKVAKLCGIDISRSAAIVMLNNVTYAGYIRNKLTDNKLIKGLHFENSIISLVDYDKIQLILSGRRRSFAVPITKDNKFPLKKFIKCSNCLLPLTGSGSKGRTKYYEAYHCPRCTKKRDGVTVRIGKEVAHQKFEALLADLVPTEWALAVFKEIVVRKWNEEFKEVKVRRRIIDDELKKIEDRKQRLTDMWLDNRIEDDKLFNEQNARLSDAKSTLELERTALRTDEVDKESIIDKSIHFIAHAHEIWRDADGDDKLRFQKMVFQSGIVLLPSMKFGIRQISPIYQEITSIESNKKELSINESSKNIRLVHPTGFEPTTFGSASRRSIQLSYGCIWIGLQF